MDSALISAVNAARGERKPIAVVTDLASGAKRLVDQTETSDDTLSAEITKRFRSGKSGIVATDEGEHFIQVYVPSPRLIIIGAVHISQALVPMAQACALDVTVIDPRTAFATEERFQNVALHAEWPEEVLKTVGLDPFTALVAVTHDPKIDDFPLQQALEAGCFYTGALGSRKTHGKRVSRFEEAGLAASLIDQIHAPIGLDIGAATPSEIAVAVLAQIIEKLRKESDA